MNMLSKVMLSETVQTASANADFYSTKLNGGLDMHIVTMIFIALIAIAIFVALISVDWTRLGNRFSKKTGTSIEGKLKQQKKGYFSYERIDAMLHAKGIYYMFDDDINPVIYIFMKIAAGLLLAILGFLIMSTMNVNFIIDIIVTVGCAVLGFFVLDWLFTAVNDSDNDDMMMDIRRIFETLKIQTKGSVHLSTALLECHLVVSNKRLKRELQRMSSYILATNDIDGAVKKFNAQFDNRYIDSLCLTLTQAQDSGKSVQLLDDLGKQIADMQSALNIREQNRIDRKTQFFELLVFIGIIGLAIYALGITMFDSLMSF